MRERRAGFAAVVRTLLSPAGMWCLSDRDSFTSVDIHGPDPILPPGMARQLKFFVTPEDLSLKAIRYYKSNW